MQYNKGSNWVINVGIVGFYGWGNCGDESILGGIVNQLADIDDDAHLHIISDLPFIFHKKYSNHIQIKCKEYQLYTITDLSCLDHIDCLIVGGGGLNPGYGFQHVLHAKRKGIPVINYGIGFRSYEISDALVAYFSYFDKIVVRSPQSKDLLEGIGIQSILGFCPSYSATVREIADDTEEFVLITPRMYERSDDEEQVNEIIAKMEELGKNYLYVVLPFSAYDIEGAENDTRIGRELLQRLYGSNYKIQMINGLHGYDYPTYMGLYNKCHYVINTGRYHSIIYSLYSEKTHWCSFKIRMDKINDIAQELTGKDVPLFGNGGLEISSERMKAFKEQMIERSDVSKEILRGIIC